MAPKESSPTRLKVRHKRKKKTPSLIELDVGDGVDDQEWSETEKPPVKRRKGTKPAKKQKKRSNETAERKPKNPKEFLGVIEDIIAEAEEEPLDNGKEPVDLDTLKTQIDTGLRYRLPISDDYAPLPKDAPIGRPHVLQPNSDLQYTEEGGICLADGIATTLFHHGRDALDNFLDTGRSENFWYRHEKDAWPELVFARKGVEVMAGLRDKVTLTDAEYVYHWESYVRYRFPAEGSTAEWRPVFCLNMVKSVGASWFMEVADFVRDPANFGLRRDLDEDSEATNDIRLAGQKIAEDAINRRRWQTEYTRWSRGENVKETATVECHWE